MISNKRFRKLICFLGVLVFFIIPLPISASDLPAEGTNNSVYKTESVDGIVDTLVSCLEQKYGRTRGKFSDLSAIASEEAVQLASDMIDIFQSTEGWLSSPVELEESTYEYVQGHHSSKGNIVIRWNKKILLPDGTYWLETETLELILENIGAGFRLVSFDSDDIASLSCIEERNKKNIPLRKYVEPVDIIDDTNKGPSTQSITGFLNRKNMMNYAWANYNKRPSNYPNLDGSGGDCTNYASQIIRAGGAPLDTTGSLQWWVNGLWSFSSSWVYVSNLKDYLVANTYTGPQGEIADSSQILYSMLAGDLIQLGSSAGSWYHTLVISSYQSGVSSMTKVTAHSSDCYDKPLSYFPVINRRWIHLKGYHN